MSNRFHNKFHRFAHHSFKDPSIPDAGYDPMASTESPFRGEFVLSGYLSAYNPKDYYSILTDNILADNEIRATNMFVTSTLTAENIVVHYIDVVYSELSGFAVNGTDYSQTVPAITPTTNIVLLSGIGLSSTSWAAIGGDLLVRDGLTALDQAHFGNGLEIVGCLSTDCITNQTPNTIVSMPSASFPYLTTQELFTNKETIGDTLEIDGTLYTNTIESNGGSVVEFNSNINLTNGYGMSAQNVHVTDIFGTNYHGLTTNNLQIFVSQGWKPAVQKYKYPTFTTWKDIIYDDVMFASEVSPLSADVLVVVNVSALDARSYGELEGTVNGVKVAGTRIGNIGVLPNANVEHALSAGLWIDNEQTFTFLAPSGQSWSINTLSGYYDSVDTAANIQIVISLFEQNQRVLSFAGDDFSINTLNTTNVNTVNLTASDLDITSGTIVTAVTSTGMFWTVTVNGSALAIPLYRY